LFLHQIGLILCVSFWYFSHSSSTVIHTLITLSSFLQLHVLRPKFPLINKRTTKCCPVLSHISPVPFDYLKAQCHLLEQTKPMQLVQAVYCLIRMTCRFGQISRSRILEPIFNTNCVFVLKNFEIPVIKMYSEV